MHSPCALEAAYSPTWQTIPRLLLAALQHTRRNQKRSKSLKASQRLTKHTQYIQSLLGLLEPACLR